MSLWWNQQLLVLGKWLKFFRALWLRFPTPGSLFLKDNLLQCLFVFVFLKKMRYVFFIIIPLPFPRFPTSLVLKSLAHFVPRNIRDMLTDDTKKKRKKKKEKLIDSSEFSVWKHNTTSQFWWDTYVHPGAGIWCSREPSQIRMLIYLTTFM